MKNSLVTFGIIFVFFALASFQQSADKQEGALGDVKYSVLSPEKFREENGNGWVLMNDNIAMNKSDLSTKYGIRELPDARGMFIRGLNLNRSDSKCDPFKAEGTKGLERHVGEFQDDTFQVHWHAETSNTPNNSGTGAFAHYHKIQARIVFGAADGDSFPGLTSVPASPDNQPEPRYSSETRPKNIALFIYVKINN